MKKKLIIPVIIVAILLIMGIIYLNNKNQRVITIDINPSMKLYLDKYDYVKKAVAVNQDAKDIIINIKGKPISEAIEEITTKVIEKGYVDKSVEIILYTNNVESREIEETIKNSFNIKDINTDITVIENVTINDQLLALRYNISTAKASYIRDITEGRNIDTKELINKTIRELKITEKSGDYCEEGYTLDGSVCYKEIGTKKAKEGKVCPENYEYDGDTCYARVEYTETDKDVCRTDYVLENGICVKRTTIAADGDYYCEKGKLIDRGHAWREYRDGGDDNEMVCEDDSNGQKPISRCLQQEHIIVDGKCGMGPKPLLPTATGCTPEDTNIGGGCYDFNNHEFVCPSSGIYDTDDMICPETLTYTKAQVRSYSCPEGYTLDGTKCTKVEKEQTQKERVCPSGYELFNWDRCINRSITKEPIDGYICEEHNARTEGDTCILYEEKEAIHGNN